MTLTLTLTLTLTSTKLLISCRALACIYLQGKTGVPILPITFSKK
jgi:hypothetical protein